MRFFEQVTEYLLSALMGFGNQNYQRAIFACSMLLLSTLINAQAMGCTLYAWILLSAVGVDRIGFFRSSHHFVMSLDMVAMFCMMLVIALQTIKIAEPSPVR
jgi:hypothetical protein